MADLSAGYAGPGAMEQFLANQEQSKHNQLMDKISLEREKRLAHRDLLETQWELEDRESKKVKAQIEGMVPGDIPDKDLQLKAAKHGIPMRISPGAPLAGQQFMQPGTGAAAPAEMASGAQLPGTYAGSPQQQQGIRIGRAMSGAASPQEMLSVLTKEGYDPEKAARTTKELTEAVRGPRTAMERAEPNLGLIGPGGKPLPAEQQKPILFDPASGRHTLEGGMPIPTGFTVGRLPAPKSDTAILIESQRLKDMEDKAQEKKADMALMDQIKKDERLLNGMAMDYRRSGNLPTMGMSKEMNEWVKARVLQRTYDPNLKQDGSYTDPKTGVTMPPPGVNVTANRGILEANKRALDKQVSNLAQIQTSVNNADMNAKIVEDALNKIPDAKFRYGNTLLREAYRQFGSTDQQQFDTAITVIKPEYARIMTASPTGSGQLTDSARREVGETLPDNATIGQLRMALRVLKQDSRNRLKAGRDTVNQLQDMLKQTGQTDEGTSLGMESGKVGKYSYTVER